MHAMCACMHVTCLSIYICTQPQESLDRERLSLEGVVVKEIQVCVSESACLCACVGSLICAPCYLTFSVLCRPAPTIPKNSHAFKSQARIGCDSDLRSLLSDGFGVCACLPPFSSLTFANDFCRLALAAIQICARCSLMVLAPRRPTWRRPRGGSARRWQQPKRRCVCVCVVRVLVCICSVALRPPTWRRRRGGSGRRRRQSKRRLVPKIRKSTHTVVLSALL